MRAPRREAAAACGVSCRPKLDQRPLKLSREADATDALKNAAKKKSQLFHRVTCPFTQILTRPSFYLHVSVRFSLAESLIILSSRTAERH